jgi:cob(I)alamin adenosyltransferase
MATDSAQKVYTRGGDRGQTSLIGGSRVSKFDPRLDAYGTLDELNSVVGILLHAITADPGDAAESLKSSPSEQTLSSVSEQTLLTGELARVQCDLFALGSLLACEDEKWLAKLPRLEPSRISDLENEMDRFSAKLKPLKNFVLPGGCPASGFAHLARTVCRRAERLCVAIATAEDLSSAATEPTVEGVRYLNRLSDYFFVLARHLNRLHGVAEPIWKGKAD